MEKMELFRKIILTNPKKEKISSAKKLNGEPYAWNGCISCLRGFGCFQTQKLITFGKNAKS